jgi:hypothetical protein
MERSMDMTFPTITENVDSCHCPPKLRAGRFGRQRMATVAETHVDAVQTLAEEGLRSVEKVGSRVKEAERDDLSTCTCPPKLRAGTARQVWERQHKIERVVDDAESHTEDAKRHTEDAKSHAGEAEEHTIGMDVAKHEIGPPATRVSPLPRFLSFAIAIVILLGGIATVITSKVYEQV